MAHRGSLLIVVVALSCWSVLGCSSEAEDAGGAVLARADAGPGGAGGSGGVGGGSGAAGDAGPSGAWACDPVGTWRFTYPEWCERQPSLLFVARDGGSLSAHFVGVRPEGPIAGRYFAAYRTEAIFAPASCQLAVELEVRDRDCGEGICGSSPVYSFDVRQGVASVGVIDRFEAEVDCTATATRVAGPGHCPERAVHGEACEFPGPCDTGCGSPCHCREGRWACEFPMRGAPCLPTERCAGPGEDGGASSLFCAAGGGQGYFDGTLTAAGDLCTSYAPAAAGWCQPAGFTCGACTCTGDGGYNWPAWQCAPPDGG